MGSRYLAGLKIGSKLHGSNDEEARYMYYNPVKG